jgi:hypothetical protein
VKKFLSSDLVSDFTNNFNAWTNDEKASILRGQMPVYWDRFFKKAAKKFFKIKNIFESYKYVDLPNEKFIKYWSESGINNFVKAFEKYLIKQKPIPSIYKLSKGSKLSDNNFTFIVPGDKDVKVKKTDYGYEITRV